MLKEPRVFVNNGYFYIGYYIPGIKAEKKFSTGIKADIDDSDRNESGRLPKDWWHKSAHRDKLQEHVHDALLSRRSYMRGQVETVSIHKDNSIPTFQSIINVLQAEYDKSKDREMTRGTLKKYRTSIHALQRFNPYINLLNCTEDDLLKFKNHLKKEGIQQITIHSYIRRLKTIFKKAYRMNLIPRDPSTDVYVHVEEKIVRPYPMDMEKKFFLRAFNENRAVFNFAFFQRMTAYRFSDTRIITREMIEDDSILWRNVKMTRPELSPACHALLYLVDRIGITSGNLFPTINYEHRYNPVLHQICAMENIRHLTSKTFKSNFGQELWNAEVDSAVIAYLLHHKPSGPMRIGAEWYIQMYPRGLKALNSVFAHWFEFIKSLDW